MFNEVVEKLVQSGMTESEIAARVGSTQPSINRIRRGKQKTVGYQLGDALLKLLDERQAGAADPPDEPPAPKDQPAGGEEGGGPDSPSSESSSGSSAASDPVREAA